MTWRFNGSSRTWARRSKGRAPRGEMNKTEAAYARHLQVCMDEGRILGYAFESTKLRLASGAWYTVDFMVQMPDGTLEAREVKGHWEEAARVRIKVAAEQHPYRFVVITARRKRDGGGWDREEIPATRVNRSMEPCAVSARQTGATRITEAGSCL